MKPFALAGSLAALLAVSASAAPARGNDVDVDKLLRSMSLDEKIGQMVQLDLVIFAEPKSSPIELNLVKLREALVTYKIGSMINLGTGHALPRDEWAYVHRTIQQIVRVGTPHKIPILYGIDSIHGANYVLGSTLFPQQIAMAAARNPELMQRGAEISALETRAAGFRWNFAPVLDVGRQPLWPRFAETFGEDPYLASVLGVAAVRGFQGGHDILRAGDSVTISYVPDAGGRTQESTLQVLQDGTIPIAGAAFVAAGKTEVQLKAALDRAFEKKFHSISVLNVTARRAELSLTVAACAKHYLGYSFPLSGADRSPALIPHSYLREYFLPPFREAVKAGVKTVMVNSGEINGMPVHASKYLLTDVLRGELGFQGVIVSDWSDIIRLHTWHRVADSPAEAVRLAVDAGLDMSMVPKDYSFFILLKQLVQEKKISEKRINQSVRRILQLKADLGLFDNPDVEPEAAANFGRPEYHQTALAAAEEAMTLLKNQNAALPLAKSVKVLVTGPAARSVSALNGCWSYTWQGKDERWYPKDEPTIVDAIREKIGADRVLYQKGADFDASTNTTAADAAATIEKVGS